MVQIEKGSHHVRRSRAEILKKAAKTVGFEYRVLHRPGQRYWSTLFGRWVIVGKNDLQVEVSKPEGSEKSWDDFWTVVEPLQNVEDAKKWEKLQNKNHL